MTDTCPASRAVLAGLLIFLASCGTSRDVAPRRASEAIETFGAGPPLRYLVLGDSTAVGEGGTYELGIARQTARHLGRANAVEMKNVSVSGARVADVLHEQLPRSQAFVPDVVLLDVGANDVVHFSRAASIERDLNAIVKELVARNSNVRLVVTGSADMSTPPRIPRPLRWLAARRTKVLNSVFRRIAAERNLTFAPVAEVTGPLFRADRSLFSSDRFHPNDRGYATWIAVINDALDAAVSHQSPVISH